MGGTPKSSILIYSNRVSRINQLFWGTPQLWQPAYTVNVYQCVVCYLHFFSVVFHESESQHISVTISDLAERFICCSYPGYVWMEFCQRRGPANPLVISGLSSLFPRFFPMFLRRNWHFGDPPQSATLCFIGSPYLLDRRLGGWDNGGSHES